MRSLGIDFGERRIGLAVSDPDGRVATPLRTLERSSDAQAIAAIAAIVSEEGIGALVVGEPRRLDGTSGDAAERVRSFARKLAAATRLPLALVDEALSSHEADARLREAGLSAQQRRRRVDAVAAQIVLQDWLETERQ